jgi:hypothetical protein
MLYDLMAKILLANNDFRLAENTEGDDIRPVIEEETGEKIDFSMDTVVGKKALDIYSKIEKLDYSDVKLTKAERVELIADVFSDDTLFEGFCLAFYSKDAFLEQLCRDYGCKDRYLVLCEDPTYRKRKRYMHMVIDYTLAATHLYGVVHLTELEDILRGFEKSLDDWDGYERDSENYNKTIVFNPRYLGLCTLQSMISDILPTVCTTIDGFVLHECFADEYQTENEKMLGFFTKAKGQVTERDFEKFYTSVGNSKFRRLHIQAGTKPVYKPSRKEFLRYADGNYYENSNAERRLRTYLESKHMSEFAHAAQAGGITTTQCIDDFMKEIHDQASDVGKCGAERDSREFMKFLFKALEGYGITFDDTYKENEFIGMAIDMANSVRLWVDHGNTPLEIIKSLPNHQEGMTVVPESSAVAKTLEKEREHLEQMGIHLDLDSSATNIPILTFANGLDGQGEGGMKKVYPNDPCPCGSGKKFKKCCGRAANRKKDDKEEPE